MKPVVRLSAAEQAALVHMRDHHAKPYVRERAAALLQLAAGVPGTHVARAGLLRPRTPATIYAWRERYKRAGLAGLRMRPGRGRKPRGQPPPPAATLAQAALDVVRRDPHTLGVARSRWTLATLRASCPWLGPGSDSGLWRLLRRLGIGLKRGREWVHSPDPDYPAKRAWLATRVAAAQHDAGVPVLYLDEATIFRQPTVAPAYAAIGGAQARAQRSLRRNTPTRLVGTLAHADGRVVARQAQTISVATLVGFYQALTAAYPTARRLYVVQDNWPVHHHPDLLVALEPQESPFTPARPPSWPTQPSRAAQQRWGALHLPIQLVWLPTYASWLNPIEKLWRKLRQEVIHMHPWADALEQLRDAVATFLATFTHGSLALKRYVGLAI
jgi:transposase